MRGICTCECERDVYAIHNDTRMRRGYKKGGIYTFYKCNVELTSVEDVKIYFFLSFSQGMKNM